MNLCATCLSSDRRMVPAKSLSDFCRLFPFLTLNQMHDQLCWECSTMLIKMWKFHQQAYRARQVLRNQERNQQISTWSNLKQCTSIVIDINPGNTTTAGETKIVTYTTPDSRRIPVFEDVKIQSSDQLEQRRVFYATQQTLSTSNVTETSNCHRKPHKVTVPLKFEQNTVKNDNVPPNYIKIAPNNIKVAPKNVIVAPNNVKVAPNNVYAQRYVKIAPKPSDPLNPYTFNKIINETLVNDAPSTVSVKSFKEECIKTEPEWIEPQSNVTSEDPLFLNDIKIEIEVPQPDTNSTESVTCTHTTKNLIDHDYVKSDSETETADNLSYYDECDDNFDLPFDYKHLEEIITEKARNKQSNTTINKDGNAETSDLYQNASKAISNKSQTHNLLKGTKQVKASNSKKYVTFNLATIKRTTEVKSVPKKKTSNNPKPLKVYSFNLNIREMEIDEKEMLAFREKERNSDTYLRSQFKCEKCILGFGEEELYESHLSKHSEESGPEVCKICEQRFHNKDELRKHYSHTHYRVFRCSMCKYSSRSLQPVQEHCEGCTRAWLHRPYKHMCNVCGEEFRTSKQVSQHRARWHTAPVQCRHCYKEFSTQQSCKHHEKWVHSAAATQLIQCNKCDVRVRGKRALDKHKLYKHKVQTDAARSYCKECDKFYANKMSYEAHVRLKHAPFRFECDECHKRYSAKTYLADHIMGVHLKHKHACAQCDKVYSTKHGLRTHTRLLHEARPPPPRPRQVCPHCGKTFASASILRIHSITHTGNKPYHCQHCEWKFAQKSTLRTHMKLKHKDIITTSTGI